MTWTHRVHELGLKWIAMKRRKAAARDNIVERASEIVYTTYRKVRVLISARRAGGKEHQSSLYSVIPM
jgi:hypothetical protein